MKKNFLIILTLSLFVSCGSLNPSNKITELMKSWEGHHKSELIQKWGPPTNTSSDGKDGEILSYYYSRNNTTTTTYNQYTNSLNTRNNSYTSERHFYVNKSGVIYYWRWKGW